MANEKDIRESLAAMASKYGPQHSNIAKVKTVDETNNTCTLVDDDNLEIFNVRLLPIVADNQSIVMIPEANSLVLAIRVENTEQWMVLRATHIKKVQIKAGGEDLATLIKDLIAAIRAMKFTTNQGPTINLINDATFGDLDNRFKKMFF
ncbi:MAG: hypothetical protein PHW82_08960 [Bacteroidales bacterium]|nr:hypothetical protein [Bacteroidales bacterium]